VYKTLSYYRSKAQELLNEKYSSPITILVIYYLFTVAINAISAAFGPTYDWSQGIPVITDAGNTGVVNLISIVMSVVGWLFLYGLAKMWIRIARDEEYSTSEIFHSMYKEDPLRIILMSFVRDIFIGLWMLLFVIPGIVKSYAYSMSYYILNKQPSISSTEAITLSKDVTKGYKGDLFLLDLSYLGWYILGLFTLGILWLWIRPRHQVAKTLMFEEIYSQYYPEPVKEEDSSHASSQVIE